MADEKKVIGFASGSSESQSSREAIESALLSAGFKKEFINRIDYLVRYKRLSRESAAEILDRILSELQVLISEKKLTVEFSEEVKQFLIEQGYSYEWGAREMKRVVTQHIQNPFGQVMNSFSEGDWIVARMNDSKDAVVFAKES